MRKIFSKKVFILENELPIKISPKKYDEFRYHNKPTFPEYADENIHIILVESKQIIGKLYCNKFNAFRFKVNSEGAFDPQNKKEHEDFISLKSLRDTYDNNEKVFDLFKYQTYERLDRMLNFHLSDDQFETLMNSLDPDKYSKNW